MGLKALYPKKKTSMATKPHNLYPYLLKKMTIDKVNLVWAGDLSYIRLRGGFCYLIAIIDWHTRFIIGWMLSNSMESSCCVDVLEQALRRYPPPSVFNSDQGRQYTSDEHVHALKEANIDISMDSVGRWADNIIIERWFRTIKYENVYLLDYQSMTFAKQGIKDYIHYYNYTRLHSSLGYKTPAECYFGAA